ncbi:hypothetical protein I546_1804 [Mycobacterium kansasii 732]|nr:hypothetical protein I546_1804 [Mycobacterium kansasii 732]
MVSQLLTPARSSCWLGFAIDPPHHARRRVDAACPAASSPRRDGVS